MSKVADEPPTSALTRVVDLLVEHTIKLDALEQVLKETNPLMHEFYLGTIENMKAERATELSHALGRSSDSRAAGK